MMNHLRLLLALAATGVLALSASPRTKTTQSTLKNQSAKVEMLPWESNDSTSGIAPGDVTLRGYNKRASDAKETFFITNNTKHRISHVTLLLRYATLTGTMLHERTVTGNGCFTTMQDQNPARWQRPTRWRSVSRGMTSLWGNSNTKC